MTFDIVSRLDELVPNPECMYNALGDLFPSCETPSDIETRTWLSVQLSICEFAAAQVLFPPECSSRNLLSKCTKLLADNGVWWTTFSGNYRHISIICNEWKPQYEAQRTVNLYKNITSVSHEYFVQLKVALDELKTAFDTLASERDLHRLYEDNVDNALGRISQLPIDSIVAQWHAVHQENTKFFQAIQGWHTLVNHAELAALGLLEDIEKKLGFLDTSLVESSRKSGELSENITAIVNQVSNASALLQDTSASLRENAHSLIEMVSKLGFIARLAGKLYWLWVLLILWLISKWMPKRAATKTSRRSLIYY